MDIQDLGKDRFLKKDPNQSEQTKDAVYASVNPVPKTGNDTYRKIGWIGSSEEDNGAPNILTGTVIISCFIQTSALPSRIEMQGNDLTFFDDTFEQNGIVVGDTSRLIFTHGSAKKGEVINAGFIMEKRASVFNTYDNVLSWYSPPAPAGAHNYMFFGRAAGLGSEQFRNTSSMHFAVNSQTDFDPDVLNPLNGVWEVEYSVDSVFQGRLLYTGNTQTLFPGAPFTGFSSVILAGQGGISGLGYHTAAGGLAVVLYATSDTNVAAGASIVPDSAGTYDLGSPAFPFRNIYGTVTSATSATSRTLTGIPAIAATSATLSSAWTGTTLTRIAMFTNGDVRLVNFTNGSTAISWSTGLSAAAGSNTIYTYL
jgi:hypothetical protein